MSARVACATCGGLNPADAGFCGQCLHAPLVAAPEALVPAPVSQPRFSGSFQSFDEPVQKVTAFRAQPAGMPAGVLGASASFAPSRAPARSPRLAPPPMPVGVRWRWPHLIAFYACAWGLPRALGSILHPRGSLSHVLDGSLVLQIIGYAAAALLVFVMVRLFQGGDWSSLGLTRPRDAAGEVLKGAAFGLALLALWTPIGIFMSGGQFRLQGLVRMLVGETSGPGLVLAAIILVLGAPLIEEIYYRGMLYEKLARTSRGLAILVSSVLFVWAHGSPLIIPLYVLAVGVAYMRKTMTLWFTIAAHGAWNLAILCLAAFVMFSPSAAFSPADGAYTVSHPPSWQEMDGFQQQLPNGSLDLALQADDGSFLVVERSLVPAGTRASSIAGMLQRVAEGSGIPMTSAEGVHPSGSLVGAWEMEAHISVPQGAATMRVLALIPPGQAKAIIFLFGCPDPVCASSKPVFERFLTSFHLN
jgi:membrane protease YdiL (CAAX protease family)